MIKYLARKNLVNRYLTIENICLVLGVLVLIFLTFIYRIKFIDNIIR